MDERLRSLRHNRHLARYVITGEPTGKLLGTGSFGSVEEVKVSGGLLCAGKKLHTLLLDPGNIGIQQLVDRYVKECQLMSSLHHPNIVQFLGVCFLPDSSLPVLVMEKLEENLHALLETVPNIPLVLKYTILEDIARGLRYLHTHDPLIIHRDLSANNVLMTSSLGAKISDMGNSRIVTQHTGQLVQTLSRYPGSLAYMPPEALSTSAKYGTSLDIFSFGHLALFTLTQVFPVDLLDATYTKNGSVLSRSEVERRDKHFQYLQTHVGLPNGMNNPAVSMIIQCLDNDWSKRPTAQQLVTTQEKIRSEIEGPHGDIVRMDAVRHVVTMKKIQKMNTEFKIAHEDKDVALRGKTEELLEKDEEIQVMKAELQEKETIIQEKDAQIHEKDIQLQEKVSVQENLKQKDAIIREKKKELDKMYSYFDIQKILLEQKTRELILTQELLYQFQEAVKLQEGKVPQLPSSAVQVCVSVIVGHSSERRDERTLCQRNPYSWRMFVKGNGESDISSFVKEIRFHLHDTFMPPIRAVTEPPYMVSLNGWGQFLSQVEFRFYNGEKEKIKYYITLPDQDEVTLKNSETVHFCFKNPSEDFKRRLLLGGGMTVPAIKSNLEGNHQKSIFPRKWIRSAKKSSVGSSKE